MGLAEYCEGIKKLVVHPGNRSLARLVLLCPFAMSRQPCEGENWTLL